MDAGQRMIDFSSEEHTETLQLISYLEQIFRISQGPVSLFLEVLSRTGMITTGSWPRHEWLKCADARVRLSLVYVECNREKLTS